MTPGISGLSLFYNKYTSPAWKGKGPEGVDGVDPETGPALFLDVFKPECQCYGIVSQIQAQEAS